MHRRTFQRKPASPTCRFQVDFGGFLYAHPHQSVNPGCDKIVSTNALVIPNGTVLFIGDAQDETLVGVLSNQAGRLIEVQHLKSHKTVKVKAGEYAKALQNGQIITGAFDLEDFYKKNSLALGLGPADKDKKYVSQQDLQIQLILNKIRKETISAMEQQDKSQRPSLPVDIDILRANSPPLRPPPAPQPPPPAPSPAGIPSFPWPPPRASAMAGLPRTQVVGQAVDPTWGNVADRLQRALEAAGYREYSYHMVPDGFVVVTRLEQIDRRGEALAEPMRWSADPPHVTLGDFSLSAYLQALSLAAAGRYRIIALVFAPESGSSTWTPPHCGSLPCRCSPPVPWGRSMSGPRANRRRTLNTGFSPANG